MSLDDKIQILNIGTVKDPILHRCNCCGEYEMTNGKYIKFHPLKDKFYQREYKINTQICDRCYNK